MASYCGVKHPVSIHPNILDQKRTIRAIYKLRPREVAGKIQRNICNKIVIIYVCITDDSYIHNAELGEGSNKIHSQHEMMWTRCKPN